MPDHHGRKSASIALQQPFLQIIQFGWIGPTQTPDIFRSFELAPSPGGFRRRKIGLHRPDWGCLHRGKLLQSRVHHGVVCRSLEGEGIMLVHFFHHDAPRGTVGHAHPGRLGALRASLFVLVAHNRLPVFPQGRQARRHVRQGGRVEMNQKKIARAGHLVLEPAIAQAAGGYEQARRCFFRQRDQLHLAFRSLENRMIIPSMSVLIGNLQNNIPQAAIPHPFGHMNDRRAHGCLVPEHLVLTLVETPQYDHRPLCLACLNDTPHPAHISLAQDAIGLKRRILSPFVARRTTLQIERERPNPMRDVVGNSTDKGVCVRLRVEIRSFGVLERRVDHPDIQKQPLRPGSRIGGLAMDLPSAFHNRNGCVFCTRRQAFLFQLPRLRTRPILSRQRHARTPEGHQGSQPKRHLMHHDIVKL